LACEALIDPLGIGTGSPRFRWKLAPRDPKARNLSQRGYRILVASRPELLRPGRADLWDSGEVRSRETLDIRYAGKPLSSDTRAFWRVQIRDGADTPSAWSETASFGIGLLSASDWKADWIGFDRPFEASRPKDAFAGAKWIWMTRDMPGQFARAFSVKDGLAKATLTMTADDHFRATLDGREVAKSDGKPDSWRRPVTVDLTAALRGGQHRLEVSAQNDQGAAGLLATLELTYRDGRFQRIVSDETWGEPSDVGVVGPYGAEPWGRVGQPGKHLPPPRFLRHEFTLPKRVRRATLHGTALGLLEMRLNGKRVGDEWFMPGWSDYAKRVYARAYDVTGLLRAGPNALGIALGDGWYSGYVGYAHRRDHYGTKLRAKVQVNVEFVDGTRTVIASNGDWKAATGPMIFSDFLQGETYDARLEADGWDRPGFRAEWNPVDVGSADAPPVEPFPGQPVRIYKELHPRSVTPVGPDTYVLDLGQNMAGVARLRFRGKPGQKVTLRFAERLNPDGTIYTTNLRGAAATDTYVCRGGDVDWTPSFTFHGFQYIEVTGMGRPPRGSVVGLAMSSDTPTVGTIASSDSMLNTLIRNAWWTQRMNFIDVPTDCPQRDERLGWTGDAQAYIRTAAMLTDVQPFFRKWLDALDDAQRPDGQYPMVAPLKVADDDGGPAWADAGVICPWTIYDVYGDRQLLAKHYPQMKRFVEFTRKRSTKDLLPPERFHCFGDWLSINATTPNEVIYEAYFAGSARLLAQSAEVLGYRDDAAEYWDLYRRVRAAFRRAYTSPDGKVAGDTQCSYVLALAFDLLDEPQAKLAADRLVADIEKRGGHLSTGFVGTRDIMHVLSKIGRNDVAFRLLHNTTFPSWGFTIVNGATSIWERWDGWTPERGFQDPGMNSFAHYAFGAVVGWIMANPVGITNLEPGFREVRIAPAIDPKLTFLNGAYDSVRGRIVSNWRVEGSKVFLHVEIPPNVRAEVVVPGGETVRVGSGSYDFVGSTRTDLDFRSRTR
jgi:alpha-L-rhamnosidase